MTPETERINGFLWPKADTECRRVAFDWATDLDQVYPHVTDWGVCVQAGGNCGVWPKALAKRFDTVYTFEPDPLNFYCLVNNATERNIVKAQAMLGEVHAPRMLEGDASNCGAYFMAGAGRYPVVAIDSLMLQSCGLIYLDIEGAEMEALRGAAGTIAEHRPVLAIENKGHSERFGYTREQVEAWVIAQGYRVVARPHRDVIFVHASRLR